MESSKPMEPEVESSSSKTPQRSSSPRSAEDPRSSPRGRVELSEERRRQGWRVRVAPGGGEYLMFEPVEPTPAPPSLLRRLFGA
jgi:hypothetical protein